VIHDVDESLRGLIRQEVGAHGEVDVVFDAPTKEWAARRNAPTIDVYLYDVREDMRRRQAGIVDLPNTEGRTVAHRQPPRFFKLSYLLTAWTQRPEDEHRLLSALLTCFLRNDALPVELQVGALAENDIDLPVTLAIPPPEDRALSDVWSALGGELKPSLDLVVVLPWDLDRTREAAPWVTSPPDVSMVDPVEGHGLPPQPNPSPEEIAARVKARAATAKAVKAAGARRSRKAG
jgi:Pvc16 N-terminal domain